MTRGETRVKNDWYICSARRDGILISPITLPNSLVLWIHRSLDVAVHCSFFFTHAYILVIGQSSPLTVRRPSSRRNSSGHSTGRRIDEPPFPDIWRKWTSCIGCQRRKSSNGVIFSQQTPSRLFEFSQSGTRSIALLTDRLSNGIRKLKFYMELKLQYYYNYLHGVKILESWTLK